VGDCCLTGGVVTDSGATFGLLGGISVLVTSAPDRGGVLRCSDDVLTLQPPPPCSVVSRKSGTILPGARYADLVSGLEVVCTRGGEGILTFDGRPLQPCPTPGYRAAPWDDVEEGAA
jgi:hypothetical protein